MRSCGISPSDSARLNLSLTARSTRIRPSRNAFSAISPTDLTRRFPRWSISSTVSWPFLIFIKHLRTSMISSFDSVPSPSSSTRDRRRLNFIRPTAVRSYLSGEKNRLENKFSAASLVGGSPGRIIRYISTSASSLLFAGSTFRVSEIQGPQSRSLV